VCWIQDRGRESAQRRLVHPDRSDRPEAGPVGILEEDSPCDGPGHGCDAADVVGRRAEHSVERRLEALPCPGLRAKRDDIERAACG